MKKLFNYTVPGGIAAIYATTMMGSSTPQARVLPGFSYMFAIKVPFLCLQPEVQSVL
jgi:hypothetical protein